MTEYTLRVSTAICGDAIALCLVAEEMARHAAAGFGTLPLHGLTFKNLLPIHTKSLLDAARKGRILVCNQAGYQGSAEEIITEAKSSGTLSEARRHLAEPDWDMTHLHSLYVRKRHLIEWGNANGDIFHIIDAPAEMVEFGPKNERGEFAYRGFVGGMSHAAHTDRPAFGVGDVAEAQKPWLIADSRDPTPEQPWYTPARYFARQLVKHDSTLLTKRKILTSKVVQSLFNAGINKRGGKKPFDPGTVLKALANVSLG